VTVVREKKFEKHCPRQYLGQFFPRHPET